MTSVLSSPLKIGNLTLKNRLVQSAIIGIYGREGRVTEQQIEFYARRAKGGVGMIVTEGLSIHQSSRPHPSIIQMYSPKSHNGLSNLVKSVHEYNVPILAQLWHVGRQQLFGPSVVPWGVSELPDALSGIVPHVMTIAEIEEVQRAFVECAQTAQKLGFDGVELHGAHGYLITQFLSPWSNKREDKYGKTFNGRLLFLREILKQIRLSCGSDFVIGLKLSGSEFVDGGLTVDDTKSIVQDLNSLSILDYVSLNQGNFSLSLEKHIPDMHYPQAPFSDIISQIKSVADGLPILATGRIVTRDVAEELIKNESADLIGLSRALISDPDLPNKWLGKNPELVRKCISCNVCWGIGQKGNDMLCIHNPETGHEATWKKIMPVKEPKHISVIGGGPAGMEIAWMAAKRNHKVSIWEKSSELGGQIKYLASMPGLSEYGDIIKYQIKQLECSGVDIHLSQTIHPDNLMNMEASIIVVATGSVPQSPPKVIASLNPWFPDDDRLLSLDMPKGRAIVFDEDGGYYSYGPAMKLVKLGWDVTIVTSRINIGSKLDVLAQIGLNKRLRKNNVQVITGMKPKEVESDKIVLKDLYSEKYMTVVKPDISVWAGPRVSNDGIWSSNSGNSNILTPIGDAHSPRQILTAVHEGHLLGKTI